MNLTENDGEEILLRSQQRLSPWVEAFCDPAEMFGALRSKYSEPQRRYHTLQHLQECLSYFEGVLDLAQYPLEVEIALWFHDGIYDPAGHDNEIQSAALVESTMLRGRRFPCRAFAPTAAGKDREMSQRIQSLILATQHSSIPTEPDQLLLVDIDLAILGAAPDRFQAYEQQIREEYAFVPEGLFREKRREILQVFLMRPQIYSTPYFYRDLEIQARENLTQSVQRLMGSFP
jgi:predicted metal-dependent HD superfamily phosphohydrolase